VLDGGLTENFRVDRVLIEIVQHRSRTSVEPSALRRLGCMQLKARLCRTRVEGTDPIENREDAEDRPVHRETHDLPELAAIVLRQ